jgi:hypothetical protein
VSPPTKLAAKAQNKVAEQAKQLIRGGIVPYGAAVGAIRWATTRASAHKERTQLPADTPAEMDEWGGEDEEEEKDEVGNHADSAVPDAYEFSDDDEMVMNNIGVDGNAGYVSSDPWLAAPVHTSASAAAAAAKFAADNSLRGMMVSLKYRAVRGPVEVRVDVGDRGLVGDGILSLG